MPTIFPKNGSDDKDAKIADLTSKYTYYRTNYIKLLDEHNKLKADIENEK